MSSSRRRKPLVTRKVLSDDEKTNDEDSVLTNGDVKDTEDKDDIPEDLPEGTVIVEPEAVEEKTFQGPEFPSSKKKVLEATGYLATVYCSACGEQINTSKRGDARRHPELSVLICRRCYKFHTSGPIEKDEDGLDENCRWCSEGGNLFGCDYCHNAFCQACIKRNLGRAEFHKVKDAEKFRCFVCNPAPLAAMVEQCNSVIDTIEKEFQKLNEAAKKKKDSEKQKSSGKSDSKDKSFPDIEKNKSLVIKLPGLGIKHKSKETVTTTIKPTLQGNKLFSPIVKQHPPQRTGSPMLQQPVITAQRTQSRKLQQFAVTNTAKPNLIYVEPQKGTAKNLIYIQPRPHQMTMVSQQAREPLNWNNVTVKNVPFITDQLINSANEMISLLKSVRINVQGPGNALSNIALEGRKTAITCMKSGVDLFLGQLSSIVGTNIVQEPAKPPNQPYQASGVKLTGGNSSLISTSEKDLIILDSENDDSRTEVNDKTDNADKGTDSSEENNIEMYIKSNEMDTNEISSENEQSNENKDTEVRTSIKEEKCENIIEKKKNSLKKSDKRDTNVETSDKSDSEQTEAENDAAHLELLQELQELSGTVETIDDTDDKTKGDIQSEKTDEMSGDEKEEKSGDKKNKKFIDKMGDKREEKSVDKKEEKSGDKKNRKFIDKKDEKSDDKREEKSVDKREEKSGDKKNRKSIDKKDEKSDDIREEKSGDKREEKSGDKKNKKSIDKKDGKSDDKREEKSGDEREEKSGDKKNKKSIDKKDEKSDNKNNEKSDNDEDKSDDSSSSDSDYDDESSDNSKKDADFDIKTERSTRRTRHKEAEKSKFKELRDKRKERERSAKKKRKEEKKSKIEETDEKSKRDKGRKKKTNSNESDFDEDLENEIEKLEKEPSFKKKKKKENDNEKEEKDKKTDQSKKDSEEKSKKEKKKGTDLDDLSSTEEDNADEDENEDDNEDEEVPMEQGDDEDDDEDTVDLSDKDQEDIVDDSSDSEITLSPCKKKADKKKKGKKDSESETEEDSAPKKKRLRSNLLDTKLSDSDSDFVTAKKSQKRKRKTDSSTQESSESSSSEQEFLALGKKSKNKGKQKKKKDGTGKKRKRIRKMVSSDDDEDKTEAESDELEEMKKKRKRKKKGESDSEEKGEDEDENESPSKGGRKHIRKMIKTKKLKEETKAASKAEEERRERIAERQKRYNNIVQEVDESSPTKAPLTKQLILERDDEGKEPVLEVDKDLVMKLKPHQVEAVEFMWNCTVESLKMLQDEKVEGAGCILAHCMGLGKTLSVIAFLHTMMGNYETTNFSTALIVCPLNTVLNWQHEVQMWLEDNEVQLEVFELASVKVNETRAKLLENWHEDGGIMIIGYEMFRNLSQGSTCRSKKLKKIFTTTLVDPGPDFVVCDEGHILKNDSSALSKAMNTIKTRRRIVLTGTPLQNNLVEYHCMVNFVKPSLLGTRKEFLNRFVNPITNGQCTDSSGHDVRVMKRRAHVLHEKLAGCVQRKDYSALTKYLPPKHEYVIAVRLANVQCDLYSKYLEMGGYGGAEMVKSKGAKLFSDYQALMRIWTHPWVLKMNEIRNELKNMYDDEDSFIDDTNSSSNSESDAKSTGSESDSDKSMSFGDSDSDSKKKQKEKKEENEPPKESFAGEIVKKWKTRSRGDFNEGDFEAESLDGIKKPFSDGWWAEFVKEEDQYKLELSGKITLLFEILRMCEEIGDKVLVFSQSLLSLDLIEAFLEHVDKEHDKAMMNKKTEDEKKEKAKNEKEGDKDKAKDEEENKDKTKDGGEKDKDKSDEDKTKDGGEKDKDKSDEDKIKDGGEKDKDKSDEDKIKEGGDKDKDKSDEDKTKDGGDKNKDKSDDKEGSQKSDVLPVEEIFGKRWLQGQDYLRMDGSTGAPQRAAMATNFNDPDNYRLRLFLISTKAGGLGINLIGANRVIIFDASWNPSHDVQSIFRVYRFGQGKPVYVYRFLAQGTMEEKIYERQVTKQSLSQRVIDEHQIDRHFNSNDLRELYLFRPDRLDDPNRKERPTPALPKDTLLAELLTEKKQWIVGYHEHDSLLENKTDQELSEEERKAAWEEFENERKGLINTVQRTFMGQMPNAMNFQQYGYGNPNMAMNINPQLNHDNLLRIVQEMKLKFPHLPQEQLTMQIQNVIRNMISRQIQQQQWEQRSQIEQRELQQQQQLQQIQARIMHQQNQLRMQQQATRPPLGMNMPFTGMQQQQQPSSSLLANALVDGKPANQQQKKKS